MIRMQLMRTLVVRVVCRNQFKFWHPASGGRAVICLWHAVMCHVVCAGLHGRLLCTIRLTHPLQELGQQPICDPARVVWQPASGGRPVSCLWHAVMCHVLCVGPQWRLTCMMRLTSPFQGLGLQPDCDPASVVWQPASGGRPVS